MVALDKSKKTWQTHSEAADLSSGMARIIISSEIIKNRGMIFSKRVSDRLE